ncbi:porin [Citreimonas salinaria]|uniref:Outer membrane protein OmpU n=1 Tax=Citreimonas salinaria TaxID=321339 RepID=A0A1H3M190_9RHOB|nr:porin [Citreimonas salinaria]SDY69805.1 outer membrane protein OmpU [Citreimonas salinaria]
MKSILFATSVLVASAGMASAQYVDVAGSAEVGIVGGERYGTPSSGGVDQIFTDIEVVFTMTGQTDNGLSYGASVDLDEGDDSFDGTDDDGATWFLVYGDYRLDVGDTDGAFDAAVAETSLVGTINDTEEHLGYSGNSALDGIYDGQIARLSRSAGSVAGHVSVEVDDMGESSPVYGVGFTYDRRIAGVDVRVGVGHQRTVVDADDYGFDDGLHTVAGASVSTSHENGLRTVASYVEYDQANWSKTMKHSAIGVGYTRDALSVAANYGIYNDFDGVDGPTSRGYAFAVNYDLGGGLVAQAGFSESDLKVDGFEHEGDNYSLGVAMAF